VERAGPGVIRVEERPERVEAPEGQVAYFATLVPGLEKVVVGELRERLPEATVLAVTRGKVFFAASAPAGAALGLLTIENLFAYVDQLDGLPRAREGLAVIEEWAGGLDLSVAVGLHQRLHGAPERPSFRITAQRSGDHGYNSLEVASAAGAGVVRRYGWDVDLEGYDYDVRVYVSDDTALVGLRLSPEALHQRARVQHAAASLNATVAHAMCRLTEPVKGETVIDPMCGAGTILIERARLARPAVLMGGDLFMEPLQAARANLDAAGTEAWLLRWEARRLPLGRGAADAVVCNLPWGRRIGSHRANRHLYPGFVRELERVLRPCGRAALLTQEKRLITRLIGGSSRLRLAREDHLSLSGTHPAIYLVERTGR